MLARSELLADNGSSSAATRLAGFRGSSVEGWEQERFGLDGSARVLLSVIAHEPEAVVRSLRKSD
jgi:DNA-binding transcriptional regulator YiaG